MALPQREVLRVSTAKTRSRQAGVEASLTTDEWLRCLAGFEGSCAFCGARPTRHRSARILLHHVVPRSRGGGTVAANVVPACASCNARAVLLSPRSPGYWDLFPEGARERVLGWLGGDLVPELAEGEGELRHRWENFAAACGAEEGELTSRNEHVTCSACQEIT